MVLVLWVTNVEHPFVRGGAPVGYPRFAGLKPSVGLVVVEEFRSFRPWVFFQAKKLPDFLKCRRGEWKFRAVCVFIFLGIA
ncbi:hypothetical protein [Chitinophaga sp. 22620]|uniref:hypothetical protein n=1 Tax=Chitinophaga sp. 22620 TaxID=3453952 RepID=UPI003F847580